MKTEEGPRADMEISQQVHTESVSKACNMYPQNRSLRTSVVQWTQETTVCLVWPAALEPAVSKHCSFPEMLSGYLEVSIEEDSGWSAQVVASHSSMVDRNRNRRTQQT